MTTLSPPAPRKSNGLRPRASVYHFDGDKVLFVPQEDMWLVHEASKPTSIARRAGLCKDIWYSWKTEFSHLWAWLPDWLYGAKMPDDAPRTFRPPRGMSAFREHALVKGKDGIAAAAKRPDGSSVHDQAVRTWRDKYGPVLQWFPGWLVRGEDPPANVTVATAECVARCRRAFDYAAHCREAGLKQGDNYTEWIRKGQAPGLAWRWWLFSGKRPEGVFIILPALRRFKAERSARGICAGAEPAIDISTHTKWLRDPRLRAALQDAIRVAAAPGSPTWNTAPPDLHPDTKRCMWAYALAAKVKACCARAGLAWVKYEEMLAEATRLGAKDELLAYLNNAPEWQGGKARLVGLITPRLYVASQNMIDFKKVARAEFTRQNIWQIRARTPGFARWFLDWTEPGDFGGLKSDELHNGQAQDQGQEEATPVATPRPEPERQPPPPEPQGTEAPAAAPLTPRWDGETRTLYYGDTVCKVFRQKPGNQEIILRTFQDDGWPSRVDDPLTGKENVDPRQRLNDAARGLNRSQATKCLRFRCDGNQGIFWEPTGKT